MEKDWINIFSTDTVYLAEIIKDMLIDNNIQAVVINKNDSAYITIGEAEVYVKNDHAVKAKFLIEKMDNWKIFLFEP